MDILNESSLRKKPMVEGYYEFIKEYKIEFSLFLCMLMGFFYLGHICNICYNLLPFLENSKFCILVDIFKSKLLCFYWTYFFLNL